MNFFIDSFYESLNKYNEELCGDRVEIVRNDDSAIAILADGLGSGVKANILAMLTSKIIATMLANSADIEDAVETIASTLPVCKQRGIAYSTFSILQIFNSGECYLIEFDNPKVFMLRKGKLLDIKRESREISGKLIYESRFDVANEDLFMMFSDGVVHAGIGKTFNLGWQWDNVVDYVCKTYKQDMSAKNMAKLLLSVCNNLYMQKPDDDATVVVVKIRKPLKVNVMIGPPLDSEKDSYVVKSFIKEKGKKVVCGGTTAQIVSRELGREIITDFNYFNPALPPTAEIKGIDLTTEGVLTFMKALEYAVKYQSDDNTALDFLNLNKQDGASRLAKTLLEESTEVHFFVGRAINPAHQNPDFPLELGIKFKLVEEMVSCLKNLNKEVTVEYF